MSGLGSNLCILGIMYIIGVVSYLAWRYLVNEEECEIRRNSR